MADSTSATADNATPRATKAGPQEGTPLAATTAAVTRSASPTIPLPPAAATEKQKSPDAEKPKSPKPQATGGEEVAKDATTGPEPAPVEVDVDVSCQRHWSSLPNTYLRITAQTDLDNDSAYGDEL